MNLIYRKHFYVLCVIGFIFLSLGSYAQMRQIHEEANADNHVRKFSFLNASTGYVAFVNSVGFTTDSGRTFSMRDITLGNVNYNNYPVNLTFGFTIRGVKALSSSTILVYGDYGWVPAILLSNDGGFSYTLIFHSRYDPMTLPGAINDLEFVNGSSSIAFAVDRDRILKTTNGGTGWSVAGTYPESYFNEIIAIDANTAIAISYEYGQNKVLRTINGGISWTNFTLPALANSQLNKLYFLNSNTGWAVMYVNGATSHYLYKTINGGASWVLVNNIEKPLGIGEAMFFYDENTGYAIADDLYNISRTTDAGANWERIPRDNSYSYLGWGYNDMQVLNGQLWAGGGHGFISLNTNLNGPTIPKAYFKYDTTGVAATGNVALTNLSSGSTYQYQWYVNNQLVSTTYNTTYHHNNSNTTDIVKLVVTNGAYKDSVTREIYFIQIPDPPVTTITNFTPDTGYVNAQVTINGTNFSGISNVYFGPVPASSFTVISPTQIKAIVGNGASGELKVISQYNTATRPGFTFITRFQVNSFSPASGPVGTVVTVNGHGFSQLPEENLVYFGNQRATVVAATLTQLQVIVPPNAGNNFIVIKVGSNSGFAPKKFITTFAGSCDLYTHSFFTQQTFPTIDDGPMQMKTCDFDNDGKMDIINASQNMYGLMILKNRSVSGAMQFDSVLRIHLDYFGYHYALYDIDNDGKVDIMAYDFDKLSFYKNTSVPGVISFAPKQVVPTSASPGYFFKFGDLDNDGLPELIGGLRILKNNSSNGNISFTGGVINITSYDRVELSDYDGDGKLDIFNGNAILRNTSFNNTIQFSTVPVIPSLPGYYVINYTTGDFDNDGKEDVAVAFFDETASVPDTVCVYKNQSTPGSISFSKWQSIPYDNIGEFEIDMLNADLNGDGKNEILMGFWELHRTIFLLQNTSTSGNPQFNQPVEVGIEERPHTATVAVADFDNDGKPDIAASHWYAYPFSSVIGFYRSNLCGPSFLQFCPGASVNINSNVTGTTYQWQIFNGSSFVNLSNSSTYAGVNTATLNIQNTPASFNRNQYRCLVNGSVNSFVYELKYVNKWTGAVSQLWNNPQNWSCGVVPNQYTNVELPSTAVVIVNANAQCYSLNINPGANISVNSGIQFTIFH